MGNGLVALSHLQTVLAVQQLVAGKTFKEAVDGSLEILSILVHQAQVQVDRGDVRVIVSARNLENLE